MLKRYLIVLLGSLFYAYEFFLRVSPSAITDNLMLHFHVGATGLSFMSAAFFYAYMPMQIFAGLIGDKYGVRKTLTFCIFLCLLATILFVQSNSIWLATLARFLMGLSASFAYIGPLMLANAWLEQKYYAAAAGFIQVLGSLGALLVGTDLVGRLLQHSWQQTYYFVVILGILIMLLVWVFVRNTPKDYDHDSSESEISLIASLKEILFKWQTWSIALIGFAFWAPMSVFAELWGPSFLHMHEHISLVTANAQMQYLWLGVAIGGPVWGVLSCKNRNLVAGIAFLIVIFSSYFIFYSNGLSIIATDFALFSFGMSCAAQCLSFGYMRDFQGSHLIGTAVGFTNMFVILGGTILQPLSGFLIDYYQANGSSQLQAMQYTFAMLPMIAFCGLFLLLFCVAKIRNEA